VDIKTRLNLTLAACAVAAVGVTAGVMHFELRARAMRDVQREATLHMDAAQALRRYTVEHIRPLLAVDANNFAPESVPAYSAVTAMRNLHERYPGVSYREVSDNPTNIANTATGVNAEIVKAFADAAVESIQRQEHEPDGDYLYLAKPLRVASPSCLTCHGSPENAPQAMRAIYGEVGGYGWKLGGLAGAQVVKVPMTLPMAQARHALWQFLAGATAVVLFVFVALNAMLRRVLLNPLGTRQHVLEREAREDPLTGAVNRRGLMERAEATLAQSRLTGLPISLVLIDVDHFKAINDTHGHATGDAVLRELVKRMGDRIRRSDILGRLGGDEFALLLPDTGLDEAMRLAQALLEALQALPYAQDLSVGFSVGVAQGLGLDTMATLQNRADQALYAAKRAGRGQVACAPNI
jgi:protein-histidine pros-kinase